MRSDPDLGRLLRSDLDATAKHTDGYDVEKGLARHLALIAGAGAAAAATTAATTATASTSSLASAAGASTATATAATATAATTATGVGAAIGVKTMIAIAAIGVVSATGGVVAVTRGSSSPEPKPATVAATQPSPLPPRATAVSPKMDMPVLEPTPTITPDDLPIAADPSKAPAVSTTQAETDNYAQARALAATDPAGALALVESGNQRFARGVFAEEREALAIDCLVRTGRTVEAQQRGKAFLAAHPTSPFAEKIRAQIESR